MSVFGFITSILSPVEKIIDELHTSEEEKLQIKTQLQELRYSFQKEVLNYETELAKAQSSIITAEAKGNWLSKSWRPILMLSITAMLINNYILLVYLPGAKPIDFPPELFTLLTVGVGGYVIGRSGEKMVKSWKGQA